MDLHVPGEERSLGALHLEVHLAQVLGTDPVHQPQENLAGEHRLDSWDGQAHSFSHRARTCLDVTALVRLNITQLLSTNCRSRAC